MNHYEFSVFIDLVPVCYIQVINLLRICVCSGENCSPRGLMLSY